ncbi:MAG: hypothetical protein JWN48_4348 [Myxococcaceae bacterium]|nr:hypothetical protein [Myxococcaceae bacterium]
MNIASIASLSPARFGTTSQNPARQLELQVSAVITQIEATAKDESLDCDKKEEQQKALSNKLEQLQARLEQARAADAQSEHSVSKAAGTAGAKSETDSGAQRQALSEAAQVRGGVDIWV